MPKAIKSLTQLEQEIKDLELLKVDRLKQINNCDQRIAQSLGQEADDRKELSRMENELAIHRNLIAQQKKAIRTSRSITRSSKRERNLLTEEIESIDRRIKMRKNAMERVWNPSRRVEQ